MADRSFYRRHGKRVFDLLAALLLLVGLSPLLAVLWLAVRIAVGNPALFQQRRPGWRGEPFWLVKFRTMRNLAGDDGRPRPDEERLTGFGERLRATSLDELPELLNVVRGEMSLVGPRPLLVEYLPLYDEQQRKRHDVRPGITGWAQVNGRNALSWEKKFELDVWYVENVTFAVDLVVLVKTLSATVRRTGISAPGAATMAAFTGSRGRKEGER